MKTLILLGAVRGGTALPHAVIADGGHVRVRMAARPDKAWGVTP